jgi:hypothetical protein
MENEGFCFTFFEAVSRAAIAAPAEARLLTD